jgi:anti-sigma-K factor RskA
MSRLEALPADQKSVLQLLLRQGKGYDDLSGLLKLDVDEVRSRAYDALDTLGPGPGGLPADRRHEISDWLLGQQDPESATATRAFLDGSTAGRAWAHGVARELEPLAGDRLPELPAEAEPAAVEPAAAAPAAAAAAAAAPAGAAADERAEAAAGEPAATPFAPAPSGAPRVSRRGGALLIGGVVAAIAVAAVLVIVLTGGGDDNKSNTTASQAADTTSTQAQPQVRAQINLTPPKDGPVKKAVAIVQIIDVNGQQAITAATQGLKTPPNKSAYALWVYNSPTQAKLVSGFDKTDNKGHLVLQGQLPKDIDIAAYKEMLVTRETSGNPTKPGTIYLRGAIQNAAGG